MFCVYVCEIFSIECYIYFFNFIEIFTIYKSRDSNVLSYIYMISNGIVTSSTQGLSTQALSCFIFPFFHKIILKKIFYVLFHL